jgi:hypothetical protein
MSRDSSQRFPKAKHHSYSQLSEIRSGSAVFIGPCSCKTRGVGVFQHLSLLKSLFLILARVKANKSMAVPPVEQKGTAL